MPPDPPNHHSKGVQDRLSRLRISGLESSSHIDMAPNTQPPSGGAAQKPTLGTLPLEVKNGVFAHFLLARNVKHTTNGVAPDHRYGFDTRIMSTSKKIYQDATTYLRSHNDVALIHVKFFAFDLKTKFIPVVATGKAAKSFKHPSVEITVNHVNTKCADCPDGKHDTRAPVRIALLLAEDLGRFCDQLNMAYHVWPTTPITVYSPAGSLPVKYTSKSTTTSVKVVWKINESRRFDLTRAERRNRQQKLLAPLSTLRNHGQTTVVMGVDDDIAAQTVQSINPRIVWFDAVGWHLLDLMRSHKKHLDDLLRQNPPFSSNLLDAYLVLASLGSNYTRSSESVDCHYSPAYIFKGIIAGDNDPGHFRKSWLYQVTVTALDCFYTAARSCLEADMIDALIVVLDLVHRILMCPLFTGILPAQSETLFIHLSMWVAIFAIPDSLTQLGNPYGAGLTCLNVLGSAAVDRNAHFNFDEELTTDVTHIRSVASGSIAPFSDQLANCKGLMRRDRIINTPIHVTRPKGLGSWTMEKDPLDPDMVKRITEHANAGNAGQTVPDKHETEKEEHWCMAFMD